MHRIRCSSRIFTSRLLVPLTSRSAIRSYHVDEKSPSLTYTNHSAKRSFGHKTFATGHGLLQHATSGTAAAHDATIFALSTAPYKAAIAIIRCSGGRCLDIYNGLCRQTDHPKPRQAHVRTLYHPATGELLDPIALVLYFPGPKTTTGEDVLELHIHGGLATIDAVQAAIPLTISTDPKGPLLIRPAEPGEFTKRAFYNNRLDLTQVEALGDILSAQTEQQRRLASRGMNNTLNQRYEAWRHHLLQVRGELEALIDFSEDQHFDESAEDFVRSISKQVCTLIAQIQTTTRNARKGELLRHGIKIALIGAPNAGKSSLLNRIVGRKAAIVSPEAGTTRDVIEVNIDVGGFFCRFQDLAGIRSSRTTPSAINKIEQEGIVCAKACAREADIVILVIPYANDDGTGGLRIDQELKDFVNNDLRTDQRVIMVTSKSDLASYELLPNKTVVGIDTGFRRDIPVADTHNLDKTDDASYFDGINGLLKLLVNEMTALTGAESIDVSGVEESSFEPSLGTTARQKSLLTQCASELDSFLRDIQREDGGATDLDSEEIDVVLAAERLRVAADCLAKITGKGEAGDVEEVLGVVFEKFCVGK